MLNDFCDSSLQFNIVSEYGLKLHTYRIYNSIRDMKRILKEYFVTFFLSKTLVIQLAKQKVIILKIIILKKNESPEYIKYNAYKRIKTSRD